MTCTGPIRSAITPGHLVMQPIGDYVEMHQLTIVSGGQTGVDLAALYAAEESGLPYCGWVPLHYTNENGEYGIPERFRSSLRETSSITSAERTEKNIKDSDGILTLLMEPSAIRKSANETLKTSPGTLHGIEYAKRLGKHDDQLLFVNLAQEDDQLVSERDKIVHWLIEHEIKKCAIGGPRESEAIGIENEAFIFLKKVFEKYKKEIQKISE